MDTGLIPILVAIAAVSFILIIAIIGFVVHRRRSSKSKSSPSSSGSVSATTAVTSSLLSASGGPQRRGYDPSPNASGLVVHHRQHLLQHPHQQQVFAEAVDRYPPGMAGGVGMGPGMPKPWTAGSAGSGSASNGPAMLAAAYGRDQFVVRGHPADSTSYSDYSSISRTAAPLPHHYAMPQSQQHVYQHPLYQMQASPSAAAAAGGPATQLHYYEGC